MKHRFGQIQVKKPTYDEDALVINFRPLAGNHIDPVSMDFKRAGGCELVAEALRRCGLDSGSWDLRLLRRIHCTGNTPRLTVQGYGPVGVNLKLKPAHNGTCIFCTLIGGKNQPEPSEIVRRMKELSETGHMTGVQVRTAPPLKAPGLPVFFIPEQQSHRPSDDEETVIHVVPQPTPPEKPEAAMAQPETVKIQTKSETIKPEEKPAPEVNGTTGRPTSYDTLSHKEFYRVGIEVGCQAESLMRDRPTLKETAQRVAKAVGFPVSVHAIQSALEVNNISWIPKPPATVTVGVAKEMLENIRLNVLHLFQKLGETPPYPLDWPVEEKE